MKKIYGEEEGWTFPVTKAWISKGLRRYVEEDKFGVYKKVKKIPLIYRLEYNRCKKHRELLINK